MKVLIVDDSIVMRKIVEGILRHADMDFSEILHAANGMHALDVLENTASQSDPLGIILCDLHMPVMDGLKFLREKQRRNLAPGVPVVMITAESTDPEVQRALDAGAQGFISKPFTLDQIHTCLASLLLQPV